MKKLILAVAGMIAVAAPANAVELVVNGDFSSTYDYTVPGVSLDNQAKVANNWSFYATPNGTISPRNPISGGGNSNFYPAHVASVDVAGSGASNALWLNAGTGPSGSATPAGGGASQIFTLTQAGNFSFSADIAAQVFGAGNNSQAGLFSVLIDDVVLASYDFGAITSASGLNRSSFDFNGFLDAGEHTLKLQVVRPFAPSIGFRSQYWDNVSLDFTAVPEPATWAMMIGGFGLVGGAMRRRPNVSASVA